MSEKGESNSNECFVIMPIGDQVGYEPGHFSEVYRDLISPAIIDAGYAPSRADKIMKANNIHIDILTRLHRSPIAVCDISSRNPNVFFELAFRQAFDMPVVVLKDDKTENPFDIVSIRYIEYDSRLKYGDVVDKRREIAEFIKATVLDPRNNSLLSLLSIGERAKISASSKTPEFAAIEVLSKQISGLSEKISSFESRNSNRYVNLESGHIAVLGGIDLGRPASIADAGLGRLSIVESNADQILRVKNSREKNDK